jgi:hypothetical protein
MGNGPSAVRMTSFSPGRSSMISYVYAKRRPRKCATNATRDPTARGGFDFHSADLMFSYQTGALSGSIAKLATSAAERSITSSVTTSTGISRSWNEYWGTSLEPEDLL